MPEIRLALALLLGLLFMSPSAHADELRPGYLEFSQTDAMNWHLIWKAPMRGGITPDTQPILPDGCQLSAPYARSRDGAAALSTADVHCKGIVAGRTIGLTAMTTAQTDVLVRIAPMGRPVQTFRLTAEHPTITILAKAGGWQVARTYFVIGVEHIIFGYDHLLFVVSLVLLLGRFWSIAKAATAFTLAHSITLIGTTLGVMGLPQAPVEAAIALSIMFLAVEIIKQRPGKPRLSERLPWVVAFFFGLLHGFGFAGALKEIGLPESDVPTALLTFNLGVEAGQLFIVAITLVAITLIRRLTPTLLRPVTVATTYGIGAIASMWLLERVLLR
jgi:hydrogenase/urease accessory protein HupE